MSFAKVYSAQTVLLNAQIIDVEIDILRGLNSFSIVGLPDKAIEESRDRVSAAIKNSGFQSPKQKNQKVVVALAPADVKKEGPSFALAYLLAYKDPDTKERVLVFDPSKKIFLGELSLDGSLRPIVGVLALTREAKKQGFLEIFVPEKNVAEAALIEGITVFGVKSLKEVVSHLNQKHSFSYTPAPPTSLDKIHPPKERALEFDDIKGNASAKRGLLIAASGGHNIALYGPPGTGKTMLARAFF